MDNYVFTLKFTAKQLIRQSKRAEKEEKKEKLKLKNAIEKGNMDGARIYAQNAIRQKNLALNYLRLSSRVDAVASRVETAVRMGRVTGAMANIVKALEHSMNTMNLEKMTQVMDQFERQFENMDVQSEYMEKSINQTTALTTPQDQVDELIAMTAEEYDIDLKAKLGDFIVKPKAKETAEQPTEKDNDELLERLARLKS